MPRKTHGIIASSLGIDKGPLTLPQPQLHLPAGTRPDHGPDPLQIGEQRIQKGPGRDSWFKRFNILKQDVKSCLVSTRKMKRSFHKKVHVPAGQQPQHRVHYT